MGEEDVKKTGEKTGEKDDDKKGQLDFTDMIEQQKKFMMGVASVIKGFEDKLDGLTSITERKDEEDDAKKAANHPEDLEVMGRSDFMNTIIDKVGGVLDEKLKDVGDRIEKVTSTVSTDKFSKSLTEAAGKHKDFYDWGPEMKAMLGEKGNLSPSEAYTLVRANNPEKAKELDEKHSEKKDDEQSKDEVIRLFGGMHPTSDGEGEGEGDGEKLSDDELYNKEFEKMFGDVQHIEVK